MNQYAQPGSYEDNARIIWECFTSGICIQITNNTIACIDQKVTGTDKSGMGLNHNQEPHKQDAAQQVIHVYGPCK